MGILKAEFTSLILVLMAGCLHSARLKSDKQVLNICMDGKHHEKSPQSTELYGVCQPWQSNACCTNVTAYHAQQSFSLLYNFNLSHCGQMSDKCLRRFYQSNCFYECSPNVGPWLTTASSSIRNERFMNVPLCAQDCEDWFSDCKDDLACASSFARGFNWTTGTNTCVVGSKCKTFKERFKNSTQFCQNLYPKDYVVVSGNTSCMKLNFQGPNNPNAEVAKAYARMKGLYNPDVDEQTTTMTPGTEVIQSLSKVACNNNAVIALSIIIIILVCIIAGMLWCKCRDDVETSRRAGYFTGIGWRRKHDTTRHRSLTRRDDISDDDQQFLQEPDDAENILNPHGALEINL